MDNKINLYLLTGFLGAGKTTFLTNILEHLSGNKTGVIMNEFGKIGIDGQIIHKNGMELIEINRGSIFCSCLKLSFAGAMIEMADRNLEYLFVESSGLADPSNIGEVLEGVSSVKGDVYDYKGAICLVDALNFLEQIEDLETVKRQLKHCHLVIINKVDLVDEATLSKIIEKIKSINSLVPIEVASFGKFDYNFLKENLMENAFAEAEESTNTPENKPKTLTLNCFEELNKDLLTKFLQEISKDTYRIKGFLKLEDGLNQIDVVNRQIDYKLSEKEALEGQLVFISKIGPNIIKPIIANWNNIVGKEMKLKN